MLKCLSICKNGMLESCCCSGHKTCTSLPLSQMHTSTKTLCVSPFLTDSHMTGSSTTIKGGVGGQCPAPFLHPVWKSESLATGSFFEIPLSSERSKRFSLLPHGLWSLSSENCHDVCVSYAGSKPSSKSPPCYCLSVFLSMPLISLLINCTPTVSTSLLNFHETF